MSRIPSGYPQGQEGLEGKGNQREEQEQLEELRLARASLLRAIEPQDQLASLLVSSMGAVALADLIKQEGEPTDQQLAGLRELIYQQLGQEASAFEKILPQRLSLWRRRVRLLSSEQEAQMARSCSAWLAIPEDPDWPPALEDLGDMAPLGLWGRGQRQLLRILAQQPGPALVGSRDISPYGSSATAHLASDLALKGFTIISGGAFGVDACAHRSALAQGRGALPTLALMAGGLDRLYPRGNEQLLQDIIDRGLVLSERPLGQRPTRYGFLQRNRIIAALASCLIVVEARWRSGALNTAHHALEMGRPVYAVPGPIFAPTSEGCHRLIREGLASLITDASQLDLGPLQLDLLEESSLLEAGQTQQRPEDQLSESQRIIWDALGLGQGRSLEDVALATGASNRLLLVTLSQLEQLGLARRTELGWAKGRRG